VPLLPVPERPENNVVRILNLRRELGGRAGTTRPTRDRVVHVVGRREKKTWNGSASDERGSPEPFWGYQGGKMGTGPNPRQPRDGECRINYGLDSAIFATGLSSTDSCFRRNSELACPTRFCVGWNVGARCRRCQCGLGGQLDRAKRRAPNRSTAESGRYRKLHPPFLGRRERGHVDKMGCSRRAMEIIGRPQSAGPPSRAVTFRLPYRWLGCG